MKKPFSETKFGKLLQKKAFKKYINPVGRAAIKILLPFIGTPISEIVTNITQPKTMTVTAPGRVEEITVIKPPKHTTVGIVVQIVLAAVVLYAFFSGLIPIDRAVDIVRNIFGI